VTLVPDYTGRNDVLLASNRRRMFAMGLKSCGNMLITRLIALPSIALATSVLSGVDRRIGIALDITIGHYHWTLPLKLSNYCVSNRFSKR